MATNTKKFGMVDKLGYMFGDFGNDLTFILSSMMLMKFYCRQKPSGQEG